MATLVRKPTSISRAPTSANFHADESVWTSTPIRASTAHDFRDRFDYASHYGEELCRILRAYGYKAAVGLTLDSSEADTDFTVLLANLSHVLSLISHYECEKLLDLDYDYSEYNMSMNEHLFIILPTVLRGTALALQEARQRVCSPTTGVLPCSAFGSTFTLSSLSLRISSVYRDEGPLARLSKPWRQSPGGGGRTPAGGGRGGASVMAVRPGEYVKPKLGLVEA
ncbi:hypothetical protein CYMTET_46225 [Cymbomonas tetramitiformis]|uniref:Uncharacterized protein n=1 Tax=Cymbomonas tetramitiformis TaxID=36881 RepID=A0AAE0EYW6_9CHLO|nr:hypothetical protein CYMTET_46225 [Cymbomonas tetramitiformis]